MSAAEPVEHPPWSNEQLDRAHAAFIDLLVNANGGDPIVRDYPAEMLVVDTVATGLGVPAHGAVRVWRCSTCGKWSHAARRPREHERFTDQPKPGERVTREEHDPHPEGGNGGWFVACGPFVEWSAVPVEPWTPAW